MHKDTWEVIDRVLSAFEYETRLQIIKPKNSQLFTE